MEMDKVFIIHNIEITLLQDMVYDIGRDNCVEENTDIITVKKSEMRRTMKHEMRRTKTIKLSLIVPTSISFLCLNYQLQAYRLNLALFGGGLA